MNLVLRPAVVSDTFIIHHLIAELARYEHLLDQVTVTPEMLQAALFERHEAQVILAQIDQAIVGFAVYFYNFSTFEGKKGLYLEDLYVIEANRKHGIGKALFSYLHKLAQDEGCGRMEWSVLDWNTPSLDFYRHQGAQPLHDWTIHRLDL